MPQGSGGRSQTAGRQDVLLFKPEQKEAEKHLPVKTDVREKLPQIPINQFSEARGVVHMHSL